MSQRLVAVTVAFCLALATVTSAAADSPPPGGPSPRAYSVYGVPLTAIPANAATIQPALDAAADAIHKIVSAQGPSGYAGTEVHLDSNVLTLYWKGGSVPAAVEGYMRTSPVSTQVVSTNYSITDLDQEERLAMNLGRSQVGAQISWVAPMPDYSGIRVVLDRATLGPLTLSDVQARVTALLGTTIPKTVALGDATVASICPQTCAPGRWNDTPPFYGGSALEDYSTGGFCSTSFTAQNNATGFVGLLSAWHCLQASTDNPQRWNTPPSAISYVGSASKNCCSTNQDVDFITRSQSFSADEFALRIYNGPWDSTLNEPVSGQGVANTSDVVCIGGGITGSTCSNVVGSAHVYAYISNPGIGNTGPGDWTSANGPTGAAGQGDSGSPMYRESGGSATALGLYTGYDTGYEVPCGGNPTPGFSRTCSNVSFSQDISWVLSAQNASLLTTTWSPPCCSASSVLGPNQTLAAGNIINSPGVGKFALVLQGSDGNLVLYSPNKALWYNGVSGRTNPYLVVQGSDGNVCEYVPAGAVWCSGTQGNPGDSLYVQADGNLVIYTSSMVPIWWTSTQH